MSQGILRTQHSPACWGLTPQLTWQSWASGAEPWMHLAKSSHCMAGTGCLEQLEMQPALLVCTEPQGEGILKHSRLSVSLCPTAANEAKTRGSKQKSVYCKRLRRIRRDFQPPGEKNRGVKNDPSL